MENNPGQMHKPLASLRPGPKRAPRTPPKNPLVGHNDLRPGAMGATLQMRMRALVLPAVLTVPVLTRTTPHPPHPAAQGVDDKGVGRSIVVVFVGVTLDADPKASVMDLPARTNRKVRPSFFNLICKLESRIGSSGRTSHPTPS